ncbi:MAG: GAF domain-containing protein [Bacteroidota bacterium]
MKNLTLTIIAIILFILQSLSMVKAFSILKNLILDINNKSLISEQDKMFLIAAFLIWIIVSIVFVILIFKASAKKEKIGIEVPAKTRVDKRKEKKRREEEKQRKHSEIEKKSNETINSLINGLNPNLNLKEYSDKLLSNLSKHYELVQGMVFTRNDQDIFKKSGTYAFYQEDEAQDFKEGIGIAGQVATNKELINISNLPEKYLTVLSGLGSSAPTNLIIFPVLFENKAIGIVELATFVKIDTFAEQVLMILSIKLGEHINKIIKASSAVK